jgi:hypothetical protein
VSKTTKIIELYRHHFPSFVRFAFQTLSPNTALIPNWHIDVIADHLARCERRDCRQLIINLPPRYLKSHCASVALPAWILGRHPYRKILLLTGSRALAMQLNNQVKVLVSSERYQCIFPMANTFEIERNIVTPQGGQFLAMTTRQSLEGLGADYIIIDDPMSMQDIKNEKANQAVREWYDNLVFQRLNDKSRGVVILAMQRLHPKDLTAHLLSQDPNWRHLCLPAIATEDERYELSDGRILGRKAGEALNPTLESRETLYKTLLRINGGAFMSQYQQAPITRRGCGIKWRWHDAIDPSDPESGPTLSMRFGKPSDMAIARREAFGEGLGGVSDGYGEFMPYEEWKAMNGG